MANTQMIIIFVLLIKRIIMEITNKEKDLIESIRNYRKAYPNGSKQLELYILNLLYELMDKENDY